MRNGKGKIVGIITIQYPPTVGGLQNHVKSIRDCLAEKNDVRVITLQANSSVKVDGSYLEEAKYIRVLTWIRDYPIFNIFAVLGEIKGRKWDRFLVVYPFPIVIDLIALFCYMRGIPVNCIYIDDIVLDGPLGLVGKLYEKIFSRLTLRLFSGVSASSKEYFRQSYGLRSYPGKIYEIPPIFNCKNGGDLVAEKKAFKTKVGCGQYERVYLFVGGLRKRLKYKRLDLVLQSWAIYSKEVGARDVLVVVGEGELSQFYKNLANSLKIENVLFKGFVEDDELIDLYRAADTFLIASSDNNEAFGMVCIEAMIHGCTLVVTDIPGFRGSVGKEGMSGVYFARPNDVDSFERGMRYFKMNMKSQMCADNREYVKRYYCRERIAAVIDEFVL